jgi:hypothetical protein
MEYFLNLQKTGESTYFYLLFFNFDSITKLNTLGKY